MVIEASYCPMIILKEQLNNGRLKEPPDPANICST